MAVFNSAAPDAATLEQINRDVIALMKKIGAAIPPTFRCDGMPIIQLTDETKAEGEPLDYAAFAGRLSFGGNMYSSDISSYPAGPVRLTVSRWGPNPDDCGKVIVGKTDLRSTSIGTCIGVTIGDYVTLGTRVIILDNDGHSVDRRKPDIRENKKAAPVFIEDNAWIGYGAVILKGVRVGRGAVVLPGSVVVWDVPEGGVVVGNPAKSAKIYQKHFADQTS